MYNSAGNHLHLVDLFAGHITAVHIRDERLVYPEYHGINLRQQFLHEVCAPLFKSLRHDGVVGVVESLLRDLKGFLETYAVFCHKQADKLRYGDSRVSVVELNRVVLREILNFSACLEVLLEQVVEGGGAEEVLLFQSQQLAGTCVVVRVEGAGDVLCFYLGAACFHIILAVESVEVELFDRLSLPQAQCASKAVLVAEYRHVVGDCHDVSGGEVHLYGVFLNSFAPRVAELCPVVRVLLLEAVDDGLLEQSVLVAYSVAGQRELHGSRAVQEARCEPSETAVAERCVLDLLEAAQGRSGGVQQRFCVVEKP